MSQAQFHALAILFIYKLAGLQDVTVLRLSASELTELSAMNRRSALKNVILYQLSQLATVFFRAKAYNTLEVNYWS